MPQFKSDLGEWHPQDEVTRKELEARGIKTLGMKNQPIAGPNASVHHTWQNNPANFVPNHGVMPVQTFPKVAKGKLDGVKVAEPTAKQKVKMEKKEASV